MREAQALAIEKLAMDGVTLPNHPNARERLAHNFIWVEFVTETRYLLTEFYTRAFSNVHENEERMGKLEALRRDEFRCRKCGHTRANAGMVGVHHIIPKGYFGGPREKIPRPKKIHSTRNLISLCAECHSAVHADWREAAVELFAILKDEKMVQPFRRAGYGKQTPTH